MRPGRIVPAVEAASDARLPNSAAGPTALIVRPLDLDDPVIDHLVADTGEHASAQEMVARRVLEHRPDDFLEAPGSLLGHGSLVDRLMTGGLLGGNCRARRLQAELFQSPGAAVEV